VLVVVVVVARGEDQPAVAGAGRLLEEVGEVAGVTLKLDVTVQLSQRVDDQRAGGRGAGSDPADGPKERDLGQDVVLELPGEHRAQDVGGEHPPGLCCVVLGRTPVQVGVVVLAAWFRDDAVGVEDPGDAPRAGRPRPTVRPGRGGGTAR